MYSAQNGRGCTCTACTQFGTLIFAFKRLSFQILGTPLGIASLGTPSDHRVSYDNGEVDRGEADHRDEGKNKDAGEGKNDAGGIVGVGVGLNSSFIRGELESLEKALGCFTAIIQDSKYGMLSKRLVVLGDEDLADEDLADEALEDTM